MQGISLHSNNATSKMQGISLHSQNAATSQKNLDEKKLQLSKFQILIK
jgi:hypothetical protein